MSRRIVTATKRCAGGALLLLALAAPAAAQETVPPLAPVSPAAAPAPADQRLDNLEKSNNELRQKLEEVQKQNQQLLEYLKTVPTSAQTNQPGSSNPGGTSTTPTNLGEKEAKAYWDKFSRERDEKKSKADKERDFEKNQKLESEGYRIGSDLGMKASWKDGLTLYTANEDFAMHIGGWLQYDNVWWNQSSLLRTPRGGNAGLKQGVLSGAGTGGINDLEDGTYFRRIRFVMDGKFWENYEFNIALAFENDQFNTVGLDEVWVGVTNVPFIGTIRAGHVKAAHGLEADMSGSSKTMTFMERSSYSEAIENNINFMTGLWLGNNYFDQRATWSASIGRADVGASTGAWFGDGQYLALGRLTALPLYECEGRQLLHVGLSGGYLKAQNNLGNSPVAGSGLHNIQLRARPELRDDVPAGGFQNGDSNRLLDTGALVCDNEWNFGTELLYIRGPFSLQAEYGWAWLQNVQGTLGGAVVAQKTVGGNQDYMFHGGYLQLAYTLTGENRAYDKRLGRLNSYYFGPRGPFTNAWFVRDEDGHLNWGLGAWELAARYSYLSLNDGTGLNRIQGGNMDGLTLGVNWYLNNNLKVQFEWVYDHRYDLPTGPGAAGTIPGYTSGYGTRVQFMW